MSSLPTIAAFAGRFQSGVYLLIGGASIVQELLPLFPKQARITIVDGPDEFPADLVIERDHDTVSCIVGDGTSALVLENAGIKKTDWLICLDRDDRRNVEVCRLARERFHVRDIVVLVQNRETFDRLQFEGVHFVFENHSIALSIQSILFPGKQIARGVGLEAGELMEVLVLPSSPIVDIPLHIIKPKSWLLAAIYRDNRVIIPHGDTVVRQGDRVLIVGDPQSLPLIAEFIHRGQPGFPLSVGADILMLDANPEATKLFNEGCYLLDVTQSSTGVVLSKGTDSLSSCHKTATECNKSLDCRPWQNDIAAFFQQEENVGRFGLVVLSPVTRPSMLRHVLLGLECWEQSVLRAAQVPVLISRGTFPYRRILAALSPELDPFFLGTSALELSLMLNAELTVVTVTPPDLVSGQGSHASQARVLDRFRHLARSFGLYPEVKALIGNPVKELRKQAAGVDLAIISHSLNRRIRFLNPDVSSLLHLSFPCSTLVIPDNLSHLEVMQTVIGRDTPPDESEG